MTVVLCWLGFMIIGGYTAEDVYNVTSDNNTCERNPCLYLSYLIDNHQYYFISNTKIVLSAGLHHITDSMIIQNISNFTILSTSRSDSVIACSPQTFIGFYNVANLTIGNVEFSECGSFLNSSYRPYWASILFHECTNVHISNVCIDRPVGYGIVATNMVGHNTLGNITVFMGREKPYKNSTHQQFTCSYGILLKYADSRSIKCETVFVKVINITLLLMSKEKRQCSCALEYYHKFRGMLMMLFKQHYYAVLVTFKDSIFSNLLGNVFEAYSTSLANNSISFINCNFTDINMTGNHSTAFNYLSHPQYVLSFYYTVHYPYGYNFVSFFDCNFSFNHNANNGRDNAILHVVTQLQNNYMNNTVLMIRLKNVIFYENVFTLLKVISAVSSMLCKPPILIVFEDSLHVNSNMADRLFYLSNAQVHFTGVVNFTGNILSTIIYSYSSKLIFTNTTIFHKNEGCKHLLSLNGKWLYISLAEHTNIAISDNVLDSEMISVPQVYNYPFPYCIFQFNSNDHNISINILNNIEKMVDPNRSNSTINKLTLHCKMNQEMELSNDEDPLTIYKQIIKYKQKYQHHYPLGIHTDICYCPTFNNTKYINCSVDQLGKVYPGQTLTIDLCLPYNNEINRILYVETYNIYLPQKACKVYNFMESKHTFDGNWSKKVNFTIASSHPLMCELFLTAQPDLYTHYDAFYIQLLPCPLGFTLQNDVCDCDPLLTPYIEKCSVNYQIVKRLTNCWISGKTLNNYTKYYVANSCPIFYCSQTATLINVEEPDIQCQQHRTGSLCSQCMPGYSLVLGSLVCKKCTNAHLAFITVILFNGLLVLILIFILNFTVTVGTPNALILYLNVIRINDFSQNLQSKLIQPFSSYIKICNLGSYFEMCVYDGMDVYTKKWIHFVFPTYLILLASLFIVASRYSNKIFWLTHNRSLPVLATLFVFTYTNVLETISSVFLFTTITSLPSNHSHTVWYLDPNIPLFGWKFLLLIIVNSVLLILLMILNVILLCTKTFMRFRLIHRLKPFIDALQGPFKSQYYYWIGVHLLIRNVLLLICTLGEHLSIMIGCVIMMIAVVVQYFLQPYKNKMINFHEMILFCNYVILCILLLFDGSKLKNVIVLNVLIGISFLQLILIVLYHIHVYVIAHRWPRVQDTIRAAWLKFKRFCWCSRQNDCRIHSYSETIELQIPQVSFRLSEFQEPLLDVD